MAEEQTAVKKLMASTQEVISAYADMQSAYARGEEPKVVITQAVFNDALRIMEKYDSLDKFDKMANGIFPAETIVTTETTTETTVEQTITKGNPMEERTKAVQAKLNGKKA